MIQRRAYAKINWSLAVLGQRPDGYHMLETLMQPISLYDELFIEPSGTFSFSCDCVDVPKDEENLVVKAAQRYAKQSGKDIVPWSVVLKKQIPSQAGLGGGSSDAAAMLGIMQETFQALPEEDLCEVALVLGADVPFCMQASAMQCGGIGEIMHPIASKSYEILLVQPKEGISTGVLFHALQHEQHDPNIAHMNTQKMRQALETGCFEDVRDQTCNDLLPAACRFVPAIRVIIERLYTEGAQFASMSGSGSCCFGVFESQQKCLQAKKAFEDMPFCQCVQSRM